ncbi:hypothetical protein B0H11DRAFT_2081019 [Mycena galericulata]|nr:hypothetical protein B0H11DRAFT_2081019 [Mycena galericulata]
MTSITIRLSPTPRLCIPPFPGSTKMPSFSIDYAALAGIHSVAGAAIFAVLFFLFGVWFVRQSIKNTTFIYIFLTLFCAIRLTAFTIRAIMAHFVSKGSNQKIFIADQILFGVGFFPLLYCAYSLVLNRHVLAGGSRETPVFSPNLLRNSYLFRILLGAGVALGIVSVIYVMSSNPSAVNTGYTLRKAGTGIFFALTVVQAGQTLWYFKDAGLSRTRSRTRPWGDRNGNYLLCLISLLMLIREAFLVATLNKLAKQYDERLWYPLVALPELLAMACYSVSGLVPTRAALKGVVDHY